MSDAKLGSSYDDKFSGMELGKLRATVAEQAAEIERLEAWISTQDAEIYRQADEIERLRIVVDFIKHNGKMIVQAALENKDE
jgi:hypothetical protein